MNSPESLLFTKGKSLFGLAAARPAIRASKRAILVEGNVDVVKLHQWGHEETVAPLGTALTLRAGPFARDDSPIRRSCASMAIRPERKQLGRRCRCCCEADLDVRMVLLPQGEDPDSVGQRAIRRSASTRPNPHSRR